MDELEAIFENFRNEMKNVMQEHGIELTLEEKIEFYKGLVEKFKTSEEMPVIMKRIFVVVMEYEIELLETMPAI